MIGQAKRLYELRSLEFDEKRAERKGKIFSFCSGKGGTGKTVLSINIAQALAQKGFNTLFVDLDPNMANANILLNERSQTSLYDHLKSGLTLEKIIYKINSNFDIIFGDSGRTDYPKITEQKIENFFAQLYQLSSFYDYIILDIGSGASDIQLKILTLSDDAIVVSNPEPTSIMDSYAIIKLLSSLGDNKEKLVIINKSVDEEEAILAFENLQKAVKHFLKETVKSLGSIDFSQDVIDSIKNQTLLVNAYHNSSSVKKVVTLAENLIKYAQMANNNHLKNSL